MISVVICCMQCLPWASAQRSTSPAWLTRDFAELACTTIHQLSSHTVLDLTQHQKHSLAGSLGIHDLSNSRWNVLPAISSHLDLAAKIFSASLPASTTILIETSGPNMYGLTDMHCLCREDLEEHTAAARANELCEPSCPDQSSRVVVFRSCQHLFKGPAARTSHE